MNREQLMDALGQLDDSLLEEVDQLRQAKPVSRRPLLRLGLAACLCLGIGAAILAFPHLGTPPSDSNSAGSSGSGANSGSSSGIYIPPASVPEQEPGISSDMSALFIYQGRCYVELSHTLPSQDLLGTPLGTCTGSIDEWTQADGYTEGSGTVSGTFYSLQGYDPAHLLGIPLETGEVQVFWNNNDLTLTQGREILSEVFHLDKDLSGIDVSQWDSSTSVPLPDTTCLDTLMTASFQPWNAPNQPDYRLTLHTFQGLRLDLSLYEGGYVTVEGLPSAALQLDDGVYRQLYNHIQEVLS